MEALREVNLHEHASKFPGQLSGGMKQRVAIARTIASDRYFGWTSYLAPHAQTRLQMQELLMDLWAKRRKPFSLLPTTSTKLCGCPMTSTLCRMPHSRIIKRSTPILSPRSIDRMDGRFIEYRSDILRLLRPSENDQTSTL